MTYYTVSREPPPIDWHDVWWRAEDRRYANWDPYDECAYGSHLCINLYCYVVVRSTPRGVWLRGRFTDTFFVLGTATKQRAVPTEELALQDLVARKERHAGGAKARYEQAVEHLVAAKSELKKHRGASPTEYRP